MDEVSETIWLGNEKHLLKQRSVQGHGHMQQAKIIRKMYSFLVILSYFAINSKKTEIIYNRGEDQRHRSTLIMPQ